MLYPNRFLLMLLALLVTLLACTSNDTLFIHLTATPLPTPTATPLAVVTRYKVGDKPVFVAASSPQTLFASPNTNDKSGGADLCFTSTQVSITGIAIGADGATYYKIKCAAANGWTLEANLTPLKPGASATVKIDTNLTNDPELDNPNDRAVNAPCKADTTVGVLDLAMTPKDKIIYAQIQCGAAVGWLPDAALQSVAAP